MRIALLGLGAALLASCGGRPPEDPLPRAQAAIQSGDLDRAEAILQGSGDAGARVVLGRVLMLRNRNREAAALLGPVAGAKVTDFAGVEARQLALGDLMAAQVRMDDFAGAARTARLLEDGGRARLYEQMAAGAAYAAGGGGEETSVDFAQTHPAPLVPAAVNGRAGLFVVDLEQDELVLDPDYARRAGVAGPAGVAKELSIGRWLVRQVPARVERPARVGAQELAGAIGLGFLMHYEATLDFRRSRLTLRRPAGGAGAAGGGGGGAAGGVAMLRAGERHLLAAGTANEKAAVFVGLGTARQGAAVAASEFHLQRLGGHLLSLKVGGLELNLPEADAAAFPAGLDDAFGIPAAFVLGNEAFRGRILRLSPASMRCWLD